MARIRTVKPEFWTDAKTGTLTEFSKCLFLGLLNHADDFGILEWSPLEWRVKIFPYHSDTTHGAVNGALVDEILPRGLGIMFSLTDDSGDTKRYIFLKHFERHQVINRPSKPLLKNWKSGDNPETYANRLSYEYQTIGGEFAGVPCEHSVSTHYRKGKERKGKELKPRGGADAREARLSHSFDEFYSSYPKRLNRKAALARFEGALKQGVEPEHIISAARRYADACKQAAVEKQFVKSPDVWLNKGCYDDEDLPSQPNGSGKKLNGGNDHSSEVGFKPTWRMGADGKWTKEAP